MTSRKWTNIAQEAWLKLKFPRFLQADSTVTRKKFFMDVCIEWQKKWPDPEPTQAELAAEAAMHNKQKLKDKVSNLEFFKRSLLTQSCIQQVHNWFDNHKCPTISGENAFADQGISRSQTV